MLAEQSSAHRSAKGQASDKAPPEDEDEKDGKKVQAAHNIATAIAAAGRNRLYISIHPPTHTHAPFFFFFSSCLIFLFFSFSLPF